MSFFDAAKVGTGTPITGAAVASCLGNTAEALFEALCAGRRGLSKDHRFKALIDAPLGELAEPASLYDVAARMVSEIGAQTQVFARYAPEDIGLFIGTTTAGVEQWFLRQQAAGVRAPTAESLLNRSDQVGSIALHLKASFPIAGPDLVIATACSASAAALSRARDALRMGLCKAAIAGGLDVLTPMTIMGFDCLQILDHEFCRPFHDERKGLNLAEGGALFLLENTAEKPLAYLVGAGAASDAHHMTHPDPEGHGMELAMRRALADAGLRAEDIGYVNAHGTGTIPNDHTERLALQRVFGAGLCFESTKALHGHTLGGAGALEAFMSILRFRHSAQWGAAQPLSRERDGGPLMLGWPAVAPDAHSPFAPTSSAMAGSASPSFFVQSSSAPSSSAPSSSAPSSSAPSSAVPSSSAPSSSAPSSSAPSSSAPSSSAPSSSATSSSATSSSATSSAAPSSAAPSSSATSSSATSSSAPASSAPSSAAPSTSAPLKYVLSNSFGFGGNDVSLIFERAR